MSGLCAIERLNANMLKRTAFLLILCLWFLPPNIAQAQTPAASVSVITITVLDANNAPLAGVALELTLLRYGQTVEEIAGGSCTTDQAGACQIEVSDPPRMSDGYARGKLAVGTYGKQTIGWYGDQLAVTVLVSNLGLAATMVASTEITPLEAPYEGQTQEPTDSAVTTAVYTATPKPSITPTQTQLPPTSIPTQTSPPPTATLSPSPTPAPTLLPGAGGWVSWLCWIGIGVVVFGGFGWRLAAIHRKQQRANRQVQQDRSNQGWNQ